MLLRTIEIEREGEGRYPSAHTCRHAPREKMHPFFASEGALCDYIERKGKKDEVGSNQHSAIFFSFFFITFFIIIITSCLISLTGSHSSKRVYSSFLLPPERWDNLINSKAARKPRRNLACTQSTPPLVPTCIIL